jgi:hypothetical protein
MGILEIKTISELATLYIKNPHYFDGVTNVKLNGTPCSHEELVAAIRAHLSAAPAPDTEPDPWSEWLED